MASKFKPTRILGHVVNTSPSAMNAREDPENKDGYIPEDVSLLTSLRVLQKNKAPLGNREQILQFFRWTIAKEKYPLPPLVRRILCMNRAKLVDAMDSMKTTDPMRTYEKNAIAEIDRFLREDGVLHPEDEEQCKTTTEKGGWLKGGVVAESSAPLSTECDLTPVLTKLDELKATSATKDLLTEQLNSLKTFLQEECCKKESCAENQTELTKAKQRIAELETEIQTLNTQIGTLNFQIESLNKQLTDAGRTATKSAESDAEIERLTSELTTLQKSEEDKIQEIAELSGQIAELTEAKQKAEQDLQELNRRYNENIGLIEDMAKFIKQVNNEILPEKERLEQEKVALEAQRDTLTASLEQANISIEAKKDELVNLQNELTGLRGQIQQNQQEVAAAQGANEKLLEQIRLIQANLQTAQQQLTEKEAELLQIGSVQEQLATKNAEISSLQGQLAEFSQKISQLESSGQNKNNQTKDLQQQLSAVQESLNQLQSTQKESDEAKTRVEQLSSELASVGQNRNVKAEEINGLNQQLEKEKAKVLELDNNSKDLVKEASENLNNLQNEYNNYVRNKEDEISKKDAIIAELQRQNQILQEKLKPLSASVSKSRATESSFKPSQERTPAVSAIPTRPNNNIGTRKLNRRIRKEYNTRSLAPVTTPNNYSNSERERVPIVRLKSIPFEKRTKTIRNRIDRISDKPKRATLKKNTQRILDRIQEIVGQSSNVQRQDSLKKLRLDSTISQLDNKSLVNSILPQNIIDDLNK